MSEKELEYGIVRVIKGRHKGKVGWYDDDETPKKAIVYFDEILVSGSYVLVNIDYLENVNIKTFQVANFIKRYPTIAELAGVSQ